MKSKKLISAILAAASIAGGVVGAQAQTIEGLENKVDTYTSRVQQAETKIQDLQTKVDALDTTGIANNKAGIEANKKAIEKQGADISKLQKNADKQHWQIEALEKKTGINTPLTNGAGNLSAGVNENTRKIDAETDARIDADNELSGRIDANKTAIENEATVRKDEDQKLQTQINSNKQQISQNQKNIEKNGIKADTALKVAGNGVLYNHATNLTDGVNLNTKGVNENTRKIDAETDARIDADNELSGRIDANKTAIENEATVRKDEDQKLQTQINSNKQQISQNQKNIEKNGIKADTALKVAGNGVLYNHATNLTDGVNLNTKGVNENAKKIDAEATARKDEDQKLQANIEKETADRIAGDNVLNSRINQVESDANKGIAKASALAALHPLDYDPDNKFDIAAAGGFYKGENAFALGAFYRPNRNVMLSMGTTLTGGDNAYNVGLTFKIGKSGKHTEAGLTTADLYAMIGAMQDKMDQQQKKIEELEAKQAK